MSAALHGRETADELLFLGAALAHVVAWERERWAEREARVDRMCRRSWGRRGR